MQYQNPNVIDEQNQVPNTAESKTGYERNMESRLAEVGAKIDQWISSSGDLKVEAGRQLEQLKVKREAAATKLQELQALSGDAWTEFKSGMDRALFELTKAWEELKSGTERAAAKFDKQE